MFLKFHFYKKVKRGKVSSLSINELINMKATITTVVDNNHLCLGTKINKFDNTCHECIIVY